MASVVVDGVRVPLLVGGHPALDFCNTRAGWASAQPKEYLHGMPELGLPTGYYGSTTTCVVVVGAKPT